MTTRSIRTVVALLALAAVLTVFLYPTVNLPATKLKRPLVLAAALLILNIALGLLLAVHAMRRHAIAHARLPNAPLVDLLCTRLC